MVKHLCYFRIFYVALWALLSAVHPSVAQGLRYTIAVQPFSNHAGWQGPYRIEARVSEILLGVLDNTAVFVGIDDSRIAAAADAAPTNSLTQTEQRSPTRETTAQYMLQGSISFIEESDGDDGWFNIGGYQLGGRKANATVSINFELLNVDGNQIVLSDSVTGKSGQRGRSNGYYLSNSRSLEPSLRTFTDSLVGKAFEVAVSEIVTRLLAAERDGWPWEGTVIRVRESEIIINRGTREGVVAGMRFTVGRFENLIDPDTHEWLDRERIPVGEIEAVEVRERVTYCTIISGHDIEKGMAVFAK